MAKAFMARNKFDVHLSEEMAAFVSEVAEFTGTPVGEVRRQLLEKALLEQAEQQRRLEHQKLVNRKLKLREQAVREALSSLVKRHGIPGDDPDLLEVLKRLED